MKISRQSLPVVWTAAVALVLYITAIVLFPNFGTLGVFVRNLLGENAVLGIIAIGMTYVILTGGIDLSVGSVLSCVSIGAAALIHQHHWHPALAFITLLVGGSAFGAVQGFLIQKFELPPFLITLAGLFLGKGLALWISSASLAVEHPFIDSLKQVKLLLSAKATVPFQAVIFILCLVLAALVSRYTRFGRTVYAIGGSEPSAHLMGLPVARTKISVYALSGFFASLAGLTQLVELSAGNAIRGNGLELDTIATVVIGGTMLSGGVGSMLGTFLGLMIFAIIQTGIIFQGTINSWWTKILTGALLLGFILLQRSLQRRSD